MAADEAMLEALLADRAAPTLRIYDWHPACLSLGRNQPVSAEIVTRCHERGIDLVRRPSGGQAVLHLAELTYAIVMPAGREGVLGSYRELNTILCQALASVGQQAELIRSDLMEGPGRSSCFARPGRADLASHGRKIAGSAQLRRGPALLQHGSLKLWPAPLRLADLLGADTPEPEALWAEYPKERAEDLRDQVARAIAAAFRIPWQPGERTAWERQWMTRHLTEFSPVTATGTGPKPGLPARENLRARD